MMPAIKIPLRNKARRVVAFAVVDSCDQWLNRWRWSLSTTGYARRGTRTKGRRFVSVRMHRAIMNPPRDKLIDHINGDPLDNRRSNLRIVTHSQNGMNRKGAMPNSTTGIRGVSYDRFRDKWVAYVKLNRRIVFRKRFDDISDACAAAAKARKRFGFLEGAAK
jgi:hypothetical protein